MGAIIRSVFRGYCTVGPGTLLCHYFHDYELVFYFLAAIFFIHCHAGVGYMKFDEGNGEMLFPLMNSFSPTSVPIFKYTGAAIFAFAFYHSSVI